MKNPSEKYCRSALRYTVRTWEDEQIPISGFHSQTSKFAFPTPSVVTYFCPLQLGRALDTNYTDPLEQHKSEEHEMSGSITLGSKRFRSPGHSLQAQIGNRPYETQEWFIRYLSSPHGSTGRALAFKMRASPVRVLRWPSVASFHR